MSLVNETDVDFIRVIRLDHPSRQNPFNERLENDVKAALGRANDDPSVRGVVVTGQEGKSFSAGGDFNEVKNLTGGDDVDRWIDRVTDLYQAALKVEKPMVAAIDGYAIGIGFQFSLMFDWRIMSDQAEFRMPELKHGIGCSMGAAILEHVFSYNVTQDIIYACESIGPEKALSHRIVREVVSSEALVPRAIEVAKMLADYPTTPFRNTKRGFVKGLMETLNRTAAHSKIVHRASFAAKAPQNHFKNILGEKFNRSEAVELTT
jgi:carboxymethylproline synthase